MYNNQFSTNFSPIKQLSQYIRPATCRQVALEYWQSHCLRERSAVAALFSGQFRSVLRCTSCGALEKLVF